MTKKKESKSKRSKSIINNDEIFGETAHVVRDGAKIIVGLGILGATSRGLNGGK